jgi:hypothetical protein
LSSLAIVAIDLRSAERMLTSMRVDFSSRALDAARFLTSTYFKQHHDNAYISYLSHKDIAHYAKHLQ